MKGCPNIELPDGPSLRPRGKKLFYGHPVDYEGPIRCRKCNTERPHTDFYIRENKDRITQSRRTECKFCMRSKAQESNDKVKVGDPRWMMRRNSILRRKYKIDQPTFDAIKESQAGVCAICKTEPTSRRRSSTGREWSAFHVDHDHNCCPSAHTCGTCIRGLLCHKCNRTLGLLESIGLEAFVEYLNNPYLDLTQFASTI